MRNYLKNFNLSLESSDPKLFTTCQWQRDKSAPSKYYLIYRWILAAYFNFVVIFSLMIAEKKRYLVLYPIFLSYWNVILNATSSGISAIIVTQYFGNSREFDKELKLMTAKLKTAWILSSLSVVVAVSLSIIYWPLIYTGRDKGINNTLIHATSPIILFIDLFINAHPPRYGHFVYQAIFILVYVLFSLIYTLSGGVNRDNQAFIYPTLKWKDDTSSAITFSILLLLYIMLIHLVLTACVQLKVWIYEKLYQRHQRKKIIDNI